MKSALLFAIISRSAYDRLPSVQGRSANNIENIAITEKKMTLFQTRRPPLPLAACEFALPYSILQRSHYGNRAVAMSPRCSLPSPPPNQLRRDLLTPLHGPVSISSDDNQVMGRSQPVLLRCRFDLDLCLTTRNSRSWLRQFDPRMVFREAPSAATPLIMMATSSLVISQSTRSFASA
jgi:hypothetical protein